MQGLEKAIQKTKWLGKEYRFFETVKSTQDEARTWVQSGAPNGALVIANSQTEGRGRFGRHWFSPPDVNLYFTLALKIPKRHPSFVTMSLLFSVAVADSLRKKFSVKAMVKWVNDVVVNGKKLCGILIETVKLTGREEYDEQWALVGIGMNVNLNEKAIPSKLRQNATSLHIETGKIFDRAKVLGDILAPLEIWWEKWRTGETNSLWQSLKKLDWLYGKWVQVHFPDGKVINGTAKGISNDGSLNLQLPDEYVVSVTSGEFTVTRKA